MRLWHALILRLFILVGLLVPDALAKPKLGPDDCSSDETYWEEGYCLRSVGNLINLESNRIERVWRARREITNKEMKAWKKDHPKTTKAPLHILGWLSEDKSHWWIKPGLKYKQAYPVSSRRFVVKTNAVDEQILNPRTGQIELPERKNFRTVSAPGGPNGLFYQESQDRPGGRGSTLVYMSPWGDREVRLENVHNSYSLNDNSKFADSQTPDIVATEAGIFFITQKDPDSGKVLTNIFSLRGDYLGAVDRITQFEPNPAEVNEARRTGKPSPSSMPMVAVGKMFDDRTYYRDVSPDGTLRTYPHGILGGFPEYRNGKISWLMVAQTGSGHRYMIGEGPTLSAAAAKADKLESLKDIRWFKYQNLWDEFWPEGDRFSYSDNGSGFDFGWPQTVIQFENGRWAYIDKKHIEVSKGFASASAGRPGNADSPIAAIQSQFMPYANARYAEYKKDAAEKQKAAVREAEWREQLRRRFEGNMASGQPASYEVAVMLGEDYRLRYIDRFGPQNEADVDAACASAQSACAKAQNMFNAELARQQAITDAEAAWNSKLANYYRSLGDRSGDNVSVLVVEGGQMKQRVMSRSHYETYYRR